MKKEKIKINFKIKKKLYFPPQIKEYGSFAEYTRGNTGNEGDSDAATYYQGEHS